MALDMFDSDLWVVILLPHYLIITRKTTDNSGIYSLFFDLQIILFRMISSNLQAEAGSKGRFLHYLSILIILNVCCSFQILS